MSVALDGHDRTEKDRGTKWSKESELIPLDKFDRTEKDFVGKIAKEVDASALGRTEKDKLNKFAKEMAEKSEQKKWSKEQLRSETSLREFHQDRKKNLMKWMKRGAAAVAGIATVPGASVVYEKYLQWRKTDGKFKFKLDYIDILL